MGKLLRGRDSGEKFYADAARRGRRIMGFFGVSGPRGQ
jgi:hypothetical protein